VAAFLFPVYWLVVSALKNSDQLFSSTPVFLPHPALWTNFASAFRASAGGIKNSFIISAICSAITLFVSVPAAYAMAKSGMSQRLVRAILIALIVVQVLPTIMLLTPLYEVASQLNLLNNYFTIGLLDAMYGVPFCVLILRAYMHNIPGLLREAAIVDGASEQQIFLRVMLPNSKPGLATVAIFSFLFAWGDFIFALTFTNGPSVAPASVILYGLQGAHYAAWSEIMAMGTLLAIPAVIVVILAQRLLQQGVTGFGMER
jgi:multiple sugar transport system permease protein